MNQACASGLARCDRDRLDHAERGAVAHAEDDVRVGGDLLLGDALGAGRVVVAASPMTL